MWSDVAEGDNLLHNLKRVLSGAKACKSFLQFFDTRFFILFPSLLEIAITHLTRIFLPPARSKAAGSTTFQIFGGPAGPA
jgi:hypothetical protein